MMQQRSTVDSRHVTHIKILVHQCQKYWDSLILLNVKSSTQSVPITCECQHFVVDAAKISNIFWIFKFHNVVSK